MVIHFSIDKSLQKNAFPKGLWSDEKNPWFVWYFKKVLIYIDEMVDIFLNMANFVPHALLTLVPPSGYILNLKELIKVSKVSWSFLWFKRKFRKDKLHFSEKRPSNSAGPVRVQTGKLFLSKIGPYFEGLVSNQRK